MSRSSEIFGFCKNLTLHGTGNCANESFQWKVKFPAQTSLEHQILTSDSDSVSGKALNFNSRMQLGASLLSQRVRVRSTLLLPLHPPTRHSAQIFVFWLICGECIAPFRWKFLFSKNFGKLHAGIEIRNFSRHRIGI